MNISIQTKLVRVKDRSENIVICAACKKICKEKGIWTNPDEIGFIGVSVKAKKGICPDCAISFCQKLCGGC